MDSDNPLDLPRLFAGTPVRYHVVRLFGSSILDACNLGVESRYIDGTRYHPGRHRGHDHAAAGRCTVDRGGLQPQGRSGIVQLCPEA